MSAGAFTFLQMAQWNHQAHLALDNHKVSYPYEIWGKDR
jgi:hypothetical protein